MDGEDEVTPFSVYLPSTHGVESGYCALVTPGSSAIYLDEHGESKDLRATYEVGIYGYDESGTRVITESFNIAPRTVNIPEGIVLVTI